MRWLQVIASIDELLSSVKDPLKMPLFASHLEEMLEDPCVEHLKHEPNPAQAMWTEGMQMHNPFRLKGSKCMPGRFMDVVRRLDQDNQGRGQRF